MPYADIGDVKLYYEIYGSEYEVLEDSVRKKPTLVALHGGPGSNQHYYNVSFLESLADHAQVIFYDQRGNGRSVDSNPKNWNLNQWAEDLNKFCQVLGLENPFILGGSFGGWVAQLYASTYPKSLAGLILIDTEAYLNIEEILNSFERLGGHEVREVAGFQNVTSPLGKTGIFSLQYLQASP